MAKKRLKDIATECEVSFEEAMEIALSKLPAGSLSGKGKNTWVEEDFANVLTDNCMIKEIIPKFYVGKVTRECPNPKYVYVSSPEIKKTVPVLIARRFQGTVKPRKIIKFEAITDKSGVSYRYNPKIN
jgi:hypothetical protein